MNLSFAVMQKFLDLAVVSTNGSESLSSYLLVMMSFFSGFFSLGKNNHQDVRPTCLVLFVCERSRRDPQEANSASSVHAQ